MALTPSQTYRSLRRAGYHIRPAGTGDIRTLTRFVRAEAREAEQRFPDRRTVAYGVRRAVADSEVPRYWVVERASPRRIVASISAFSEWSDWHAAPYWWIQSLYVVTAERGQGLARAMIAFVEREAALAGVVELRLYVSRTNDAAGRLYRRAGFRDAGYEMLVHPLATHRS